MYVCLCIPTHIGIGNLADCWIYHTVVHIIHLTGYFDDYFCSLYSLLNLRSLTNSIVSLALAMCLVNECIF